MVMGDQEGGSGNCRATGLNVDMCWAESRTTPGFWLELDKYLLLTKIGKTVQFGETQRI